MLFNLATRLFSDRTVRRALVQALDGDLMNQSVWAGQAKVPPGPMPQFWSVWDPAIRTLPYDTAAAARVLGRRGGRELAFQPPVPPTGRPPRAYTRLHPAQLATGAGDGEIARPAAAVMPGPPSH